MDWDNPFVGVTESSNKTQEYKFMFKNGDESNALIPKAKVGGAGGLCPRDHVLYLYKETPPGKYSHPGCDKCRRSIAVKDGYWTCKTDCGYDVCSICDPVNG